MKTVFQNDPGGLNKSTAGFVWILAHMSKGIYKSFLPFYSLNPLYIALYLTVTTLFT